jgi:pyruvoyl-dependent arginine decarboxylase (PvlArgDC)
MAFIKVVFPTPFCPTNAYRLPLNNFNLLSRSKILPPYARLLEKREKEREVLEVDGQESIQEMMSAIVQDEHNQRQTTT